MTILKTRFLSSLCVSVILCGLSFAAAEEAATSETQALKAKVISVKGIAKKMEGNQTPAKWTPLKAEESLSQYTVVRTGFNSEVLLHFADRGQVTIHSGTKVGISEFAAVQGAGGAVKANLGLKYGSMRLKVDRSRGASDFSVSTAVATLAVRGTDGLMSFFADLGVALWGEEGTWAVETSPVRTPYLVKGNQRSQRGTSQGRPRRSSNIKNMERDVQLGDSSGGQTEAEKENLWENGGGRGIFGFAGNPTSTSSTPTGTTEDPEAHHITP